MDDQKGTSEDLMTHTSISSCSPEIQKRESARAASPAADKARDSIDATGIVFYTLLIVWFLGVFWKIADGTANLLPVVAGCVLFETFNRILSSLIAKPTFLPRLQAKHVDNFVNTAVSLLHSLLIAFAVMGLLLRERKRAGLGKMWTHRVLTEETWPGAFAVLGVSCGYSAYDQWDMLRRHLYKPKSPSVLTHHAVILTCFIFALCKKSCINYLILTLVCEFHSIFLHLRKVLLMAGVDRKWSFWVSLEWTLNWMTFVVSRIAFHVLITLKLLKDFKKFGSGVELPLALLGMTGLNVLNFELGVGLYKAYIRESSQKPSSVKEAED